MNYQAVAQYILPPLCAALVGSLATLSRQLGKSNRAMRDGMRSLLRQQLIDYHREYVVGGIPCPVRVKEQATSVYESYHALGGNGTGTQLWQEIMKQHIE